MSRTVKFHEAARAELREAATWYERNRDGLGAEFLAEVAISIERVAAGELPGLRTLEIPGKDVRRVLLHRFPYAVYFEIHGTDCFIWAVAHGKRRPGYWQKRL